MPLALSGSRIILSDYPASTAAELGDRTISRLQWAGWVVESTTTHGYRLQCESPQGMDVFMYVEDLGHRLNLAFQPTLTFRFETLDGLVTGQDQEVEVNNASGYELWANRCSLFLSQKGIDVNSGGGNFCGGIPFIPGAVACNSKLQTDGAMQAFWAMGDYNTGTSPRHALITYNTQNNCEAGWNDKYSPGGSFTSSLRIPAVTIASAVTNGLNFPTRVIWYSYDELFYEPFLCWGLESGDDTRLRGQIYDAVCYSKARVLETTFTAETIPFLNWTNNWFYGGIGLLLASEDLNAGNIAITRM